MKKQLLLVSILTGIILLFCADIYSQNAANIRTFSKIRQEKIGGNLRTVKLKKGQVDTYFIKLVKGHFYGFTVSAKGFSSTDDGERIPMTVCNPVKGNDVSLTFLVPKRNPEYFKIDARQYEGAESVFFTSDHDLLTQVIVQIDAPRCWAYRFQLITSDPAISGIPEPRVTDLYSLKDLGVKQVNPPALDQSAQSFFSPIMTPIRTIENWRTQIKNMSQPYRKAFDWLEYYDEKEEDFWFNAHQSDFKMLDSISNKQDTLKQMQTAYGELIKTFYEPKGKLFAYFRLLELNQQIQAYKQSINNSVRDSGKSQELIRELDNIQALYNAAAPKAISNIDTLISKGERQKEATLVNESIGPLYNQLFHRLNLVKKKGIQANVRWNCQFFKTEASGNFSIELPFCKFQ